MAHWSSGQDASLSRWKLGFDSRMGHHKEKHDATRRVFLYANSTESEPRVFPQAETHKVCGKPNFIYAQISSAHMGSDSRMGHQKQNHRAPRGDFVLSKPKAWHGITHSVYGVRIAVWHHL